MPTQEDWAMRTRNDRRQAGLDAIASIVTRFPLADRAALTAALRLLWVSAAGIGLDFEEPPA